MRKVLLLAACAWVIAVAPATAQGNAEVPCRKGVLWPFSRSPGDCLTDVEKRNGQTGVYGNPNATAAAQPVQAAPAAPAAPPPRAAAPAPAVAAAPAPSVAAAPARPAAPIAQNGEVACSKGWFWPFSRNPGDCLTDAEKKNGQTGVYGNPNAVARAPATIAAPAAPAARPAPAVAALPVAPPAARPAAPAVVANGGEVACNKGWFWPFSRSAGDCLTDAEKKNGQTGVYGDPYGGGVAASTTGATQVAIRPAEQSGGGFLSNLFGSDTPTVPAGNRGLLEDSFGPAPVAAPAAPVAQAAPQVATLAAPPQPAAPPPVAAPPPRAAAPAPGFAPPPPAMAAAPQGNAQAQIACTKGWFWPFARREGECLTDVEIQNGQTGVFGNPNAAVATPVVAAARPAPQPAAQARIACTKSWFWPYSRRVGDCLTDEEVQSGQIGVYGNPNAVASLAAPSTPAFQAPAPAAAAPPRAPAPPPPVAMAPAAPVAAIAGAATCNKGWFWPFSRKPGDCLTDAEKKNGATGVYGNPNGAAIAPAPAAATAAAPQQRGRFFGLLGGGGDAAPATVQPASAPAAPAAAAPAPAAIPVSAADAAECTKGWFWPFSRKPGDCLTDVEKKNGQTGVYGRP